MAFRARIRGEIAEFDGRSWTHPDAYAEALLNSLTLRLEAGPWAPSPEHWTFRAVVEDLFGQIVEEPPFPPIRSDRIY